MLRVADLEGDRRGHAAPDLLGVSHGCPADRIARECRERAFAQHDTRNRVLYRKIQPDPYRLDGWAGLSAAHPAGLKIAVDQVNGLHGQVIVGRGTGNACRRDADIIPLDPAAVLGMDFDTRGRVARLARRVVKKRRRFAQHPAESETLDRRPAAEGLHLRWFADPDAVLC